MTGVAEQVPRAEVPAHGSLIPRAGGGEKPLASSKCTYRTKTTRRLQARDNANPGALAPSGQDGPRGTHGRLLQSCPQRRARQPWVGAERMCGLLLNLVKALCASDEVLRFPRSGVYRLLAYKDKKAGPAKTVPVDRGRGGRGSG
jgi:hypothetical protein